MGIKKTMILFLAACGFLLHVSPAAGQSLDGKSYYTLVFDIRDSALTNSKWLFADNSTRDEGDNATKTGTIYITSEGTVFQSSHGTYVSSGTVFNGSWEATEKKYSSYYQENIYTYYSVLFFGIALGNDSVITGITLNSMVVESQSTGSEEDMRIVPFLGFLVGLMQ